MAFIDFIFQSGDFHEPDTGIGIKDLFINTLFPIIVFFVGFYVSHIYNQIQKKKDILTFREYYINTLEYLKEAVSKQIDEFEKLSIILKENNDNTIEFRDSPDFSTELIWEISRDKLYDCFVKIKKDISPEIVTNYNKVIFCVQDIRFIEKNSINIMNDLIKGLREYNQSFLNNQRTLLKERDRFYHETSKTKIQSTFHQESEQILNNWTKIKDYRTQNNTNDYLAKPLKKLCEKYPTESYSIKYMEQLTTMLSIHENMIRFKNDYSNTYNSYYIDLKKDIESIEESLQNLSKYKDKMW